MIAKMENDNKAGLPKTKTRPHSSLGNLAPDAYVAQLTSGAVLSNVF